MTILYKLGGHSLCEKNQKQEVKNMQEKITQGNVLELWAKQYPDVERWLNHLQQKPMNAYSLYRFCEWSKFTPTQLLDEKKKNPSANVIEKILDDFCNTDDKSFTNSFRYQASIAVKSFFRWNYADLAKASGAVTLEKIKPYNPLSKEILRKLWTHARNLRDRALIPFIASTAIAKETLSKVTWKLLEEGWELKEIPCIQIPPQLLKGHGVGRYKDVKQVTFLTPEAQRALLDYKGWQEKRLGRKVRPDEHIWRSLRGSYSPLTYDSIGMLITRLAEEAGVDFSCHDARRWVNTCLEQIGISSNWARKIRGRKVKGEENPYSQPNIEQLRQKYKEAVPLLEFTHEDTTGVEAAKQAAREEYEKLFTPEQKQFIEAHTTKRFSKKGSKREPEEADCPDGEHCQRVIGEEELAKLLSEGWRASLVLPSGKVVVTR
jgi:hypothetical protein